MTASMQDDVYLTISMCEVMVLGCTSLLKVSETFFLEVN